MVLLLSGIYLFLGTLQRRIAMIIAPQQSFTYGILKLSHREPCSCYIFVLDQSAGCDAIEL